MNFESPKNKIKYDLLVFPNPSSGEFSLSCNSIAVGEQIIVNLYDITGKLIEQKQMVYQQGCSIFFRNIASGQYLLRIAGNSVNLTTAIQIL